MGNHTRQSGINPVSRLPAAPILHPWRDWRVKTRGRKFAGALVQRCQVHKMGNIINKQASHLARPTLKKLINKAFTAKGYQEGFEQAQEIVEDYQESFPCLRARTGRRRP